MQFDSCHVSVFGKVKMSLLELNAMVKTETVRARQDDCCRRTFYYKKINFVSDTFL